MNAENAYFYRDHARADGHAWETCVGGHTGIMRGVRYHRSLSDVLAHGQMVQHTIRGDGTWFGVYMRQTIDGREQEQIIQVTLAGAVLTWNGEPLRAWNNLSNMATEHMNNARPDNARPNQNGWIRVLKRTIVAGITEWVSMNVATADQSGVLPFNGRVRAPVVAPVVVVAPDIIGNPLPPVQPRPARVPQPRWVAPETEQIETKDCDICMVEQERFITRQCGHQSCWECNLMTRKAKITSWYENTPVANITLAQAYSRATACAVCRAMN